MDCQHITVHVTGFGVGGKVWLSECAAATYATDQGCGVGLPEQTLLVTDDSRSGSASFTVHDQATFRPGLVSDIKPCAAACVIVATMGVVPGRPRSDKGYAYTPIRFVYK